MKKRLKKWGKRLLYLLGFLMLFLIGMEWWCQITPPTVSDKSTWELKRTTLDSAFYTLGENWLRQNEHGLWEAYVEGAPFERGAVLGNLAQELIVQQEVYFVRQIKELVPSEAFLYVLRFLIGFFNRNIADYIPVEFQQEIYGESHFYSHEFTAIGSNYERALNYHAAHDIGHALKDYAVVGCTSFSTWDSASVGGHLLIGRNFDFYVGDDFAKDKMILFVRPDSGYNFASVTWGGFMGVVSGMNEQGLTVTLNAAKSGIPSAAKTPISMVARHILQYAQNIDEAFAIARQYETFVSESLLIGSAQDGHSAIIEKSVDQLALFRSTGHQIICSNHYQSDTFLHQVDNQYNIEHSASAYRQERTKRLMETYAPLDYQDVATILRDRQGLGGIDIGLGNEKALNQLQGHHSVLFAPSQRLMWVSTSPYQLGAFLAYDLRAIFGQPQAQDASRCVDSLTIAPDTFAQTPDFEKYIQFRTLKKQVQYWTSDGAAHTTAQSVNVEALVALNPHYYHAYELVGNYYRSKEQYALAIAFYEKALTLEIATTAERQEIEENLIASKKKLPL